MLRALKMIGILIQRIQIVLKESETLIQSDWCVDVLLLQSHRMSLRATDGRRMEEAIGFASQSIQRMKAFQFGLEMRFFTYFSGFSAVCRSQQKS